jgi:hypothetical protein
MINARYTLTLKTIMEDENLKPKLEQAMSTYPLYVKQSKEEYIPSYIPTREELNKKILNYYKYREIGFETIARFLDELEISLNEIMPYYNQLFFSADQDFNILYNVDYKRTIDTNKTGTTSTEGTSSLNGSNESHLTGTDTNTASGKEANVSKAVGTESVETTENTNATNKEISSDTPQDSLSITAKNIDNVTYADNVKWQNGTNDHTMTVNTASENDSTSETTNSSTNTLNTKQDSNGSTSESTTSSASGSTNDTENTLETTKGNFGVMSSQTLVKQYRDNILNIEQRIINDERIRELFMLVY